MSFCNITKNDLPDNLTINGDLLLNNNKGLKRLPNNLTVNGYLNISKTSIISLPKNLKVTRLIYQDTPLAKKFQEENIEDVKKEIEKMGGEILNKHHWT